MWLWWLACTGPNETTSPTEPEAPADPEAPVLPAPDPAFHLGLAGAPLGTFGDAAAPTFGAGFAALADEGFDRFLPVFLTDESGSSTEHLLAFLPPVVLPGVPRERTCAGPSNPWTQAPDALRIVLPAYLPLLDQLPSAPLDGALARERLGIFVEDCLGGEIGRVAEAYLYDEPSNNAAMGSGFDLDNVGRLAAAVDDVLGVETMLVEAPLPLLLELGGVPQAELDRIEPIFWEGVDRTAAHADHYGFDVYLVDLTDDLSGIGDYLAHARERAPGAAPIAVLQGFGFAEMGMDVGSGREPTRDETRLAAFLTLIGGASSVWWYGQSAVEADAPVWADLREASRDLRRVSGLGRLPAAEIGVEGAVASMARQDGEVRWVVLANPTARAAEVTLSWGESAAAWDGLGGQRLADGADALTLTLDAYGTRVVSIRSVSDPG